MTEHAEAIGLEKKFIEAGHWRIEGWDVLRFHHVVHDRLMWKIVRGEAFLGIAYTLAQIDELISRCQKAIS